MISRQTFNTPCWAVWKNSGEDAIFVGIMPMETLRRLLNLHKEAEARIILETEVEDSWCELHNNRLGTRYKVRYAGTLVKISGIGPP